ncbi:hypothetical protein V8C35DRAFT_289562 [Trichoderma chlorosporum]
MAFFSPFSFLFLIASLWRMLDGGGDAGEIRIKTDDIAWRFACLVAETPDGDAADLNVCIECVPSHQMSLPSLWRRNQGNDTGLTARSGCLPGSAILLLQMLAASITTPCSVRQLFQPGGVTSTGVGMGSMSLSTGLSAKVRASPELYLRIPSRAAFGSHVGLESWVAARSRSACW